jgi:DNA-binding beta-propeller fold protein YncE
LTSNNGHLFVTRYGSNQLTVYNTSTFELIRHITVPGANISLLGLAPCPTDDCVYVSDYRNGKVHVVNFQSTINNNSASATSWTVADEPTGLSVNSRGNLLTAHDSGKIQEYTPSGSLVREISTSNKLLHAVEHLNGNLAVSSEEPFVGVLLLSVDGQVLGSYGTTTKDVPTTIAVDKDGFILAADFYKQRILVINPTLSEARPLPLHDPHTGRLNWPYGLWLDEPRGRLYVGEIRELVRVLVYDNVFNVGADFTT